MSTVEKYGRFIEEEGCFLLEQEPPKKWVNLHYNKIGDDEVYAEITNIGDGPVWVRDKEGNTCTLVSYDAKYLYIRDEESGTVFSPWGAPAPQPVTDRYCKYYAAKTEISGTCEGLKATQRVFVPKDYTMEVWTVNIENKTDRPRRISVFASAMFQLTGYDKEGKYVGKDNYAVVHPELGGTFITNRNVFVPTSKYKGYLVAFNNFVGGSGYRDHFFRSEFASGTPRILYGWNCENKPGYGPDCAGVVQTYIEIPPHASGRVDFLLGQATSIEEVKAVKASLTTEKLDVLCEEQMEIERKRASAFKVNTGNKNYDGLMNDFVKKQMYSYLINKSGFRDNLQTDCALAMVDYEVAKANFLRALASQYPSGKVIHGFRPLNRLTYSDKPAWILMTAPALIKESGDFSLLEEVVPYFESDESGTVWDHMLRTMRYLINDTGKHGLCRQHHADWNDGLEATAETGERESVMVTQQLCYGLIEMAELAEILGEREVEKEAKEQYEIFKNRLNEVAWDGEWYVRFLCEDGYKAGSNANEQGKILINSQSWSVISQTAIDDRGTRCMDSLEKLLGCEVGYRLVAPAFSKYDPRIGRMSNSMPGHAENGGCYNHAAGFKGVADCILGRAKEAWDTFVKVAPDNPANPVSNSLTEPFSFTNLYSTCEYVYGQSCYPWRTGTAGWFTMLLVEWILGARRSYKGLIIDPCLTADIPQASITRTFRGAVYEITLDNTAGRCKGVTSIIVDGEKLEGNVLPDFRLGVHRVQVVI
jgi:cellobiose phosphorylase